MDKAAPINLMSGELMLEGWHQGGAQLTLGVSEHVDWGGRRLDPTLGVAAGDIEAFTVGLPRQPEPSGL